MVIVSARVVPFPAGVVSILLALVSMQIQRQVVPLQTHKFRASRVWPRLPYLIVWRHVVTPGYGKRTRKAFACLTYLDRYTHERAYTYTHSYRRSEVLALQFRAIERTLRVGWHLTCPYGAEVFSMPGVYRARQYFPRLFEIQSVVCKVLRYSVSVLRSPIFNRSSSTALDMRKEARTHRHKSPSIVRVR